MIQKCGVKNRSAKEVIINLKLNFPDNNTQITQIATVQTIGFTPEFAGSL